jgi:hypothetical protein
MGKAENVRTITSLIFLPDNNLKNFLEPRLGVQKVEKHCPKHSRGK